MQSSGEFVKRRGYSPTFTGRISFWEATAMVRARDEEWSQEVLRNANPTVLDNAADRSIDLLLSLGLIQNPEGPVAHQLRDAIHGRVG